MIRIKVDIDRLSLDEAIFLEESGARMPARLMKQILAKVIVDEQGQFLEEAAALKEVGQLLIPEVREAFTEFRSQIRANRENAVPPTSSGN